MRQALTVVEKHEVIGHQAGQFVFKCLQELSHHRRSNTLFLHFRDAALDLVMRLDHGDHHIPQVLAALVHPQRSQFVQPGLVVRRREDRVSEQLTGDAMEQLCLDGGQAAEIKGLALQQQRQLQILFQKFEIVGKMAGQQGRHSVDMRRLGGLHVAEQPDADLVAFGLQPGVQAPAACPVHRKR